MKTLSSESYNIAWFKLADFVARGEKERALSVLRLLMHSVSNEALTHQLEGDILLAFNDQTAMDRYFSAANLFKKTGNLQQAVGAYQQALWFKDDENILQLLLETYALLKHKTGLIHTFAKIAKIMLENNNFEQLNLIFFKTLDIIDQPLHTLLHAQFCVALLLYDQNNDQIANFLKETIKLFQIHIDHKYIANDLQKFLSEIKALSTTEYKKIELLLKERHEQN